MNSSQPIGIFDSGIGGLTVAHAIVQALPTEDIIYFGDTAHLPYGDKSAETIQTYALAITQLLLKKQCKLILIACNSASAAAYQTVKNYVGNQAIVLNVIDPMISHLNQQINNQKKYNKIGLIGTRQTVTSNIYQKKIAAAGININLISRTTNLLASAIEEFGNHSIINNLIDAYLSDENFHDIEALILACTHYPIIKNKISEFFKNKFKHNIDIIDASEIVARATKNILQDKNLLKTSGNGSQHFYVSDYTDSFVINAKKFFSENIKLEHYPLTESMEIIT